MNWIDDLLAIVEAAGWFAVVMGVTWIIVPGLAWLTIVLGGML